MEGLLYEKKVKDMQKYIPFLENLITKLEKSKEKSRETQLTKMRMLYGLLTKKDKKLKLDTLLKCENVLEKLYKKVEKNLGDCDLGIDKKPIIKSSEKTEKPREAVAIEELSAPASPQNSDANVEFHAPIVIPTERKNSPTLPGSYRNKDKNVFNKNRNLDKYDRSAYKDNDSKTELYRRRSPSRYDQSKGCRYSDKSSHSSDRYESRKDRYYEDDRQSDRANRTYEKNSYFERRPYNGSPSNEMWASNENKPATNINPNANTNTSPNTTVNTSTSPSANTNRTIVSPTLDSKNRDTIFQRLGTKLDVSSKDNYENFKIKITNDKLKKKRAPTPLFEVLQSPPLSANDIDDLMNESGGKADKDERKDLSDLEAVRKKLNNEIGICKKKAKEQAAPKEHHGTKSSDKDYSSSTREPTTKEPHSPKNQSSWPDNPSTSKSSEHLFKGKHSNYIDNSSTKSDFQEKLFPQPENQSEMTDLHFSSRQTETSNVRLAYKYNPHPRRSTESSKFEEPVQNIAKPSDPRINRSTINTLPSVNLADPRLRNRPILPVPPSNMLDVNLSSPAYSTQDARRPARPVFPIFPSFQQQVPKPVPPPIPMSNPMIRPVPPQPVPPPQISNQASHPVSIANQMARPLNVCNQQPPSLLSMPIRKPPDPVPSNLGYNNFHPMMNDQVERIKYLESKKNKFEPKTYGEYRQARLAEQHHKDKNIFEPHRSPIPRRESVDVPPSCLDQMYRKSEFKHDVPSVSSFKIPKVVKSKHEDANKSLESDEESFTSKDSTKEIRKSTKPDDKKDKTKSQGVSISEKDKVKSEKIEDKRDKSKSSESNKPERSDNKNKLDERKKENETDKTKIKVSSDVQKKIPKDDLVKCKSSEPARSKKSNTESRVDKEAVENQEEDSIAVIEDTNKNDKGTENNNESSIDSSSDTKTEEKAAEISDSENVPLKIKQRRRKSVCEILPSTTDGSEISTQNIITGKRRTRSVLPPPSEAKTPEPKVPPIKRRTRSRVIETEVKKEDGESTANVKSEEQTEETKPKKEVKMEIKEDSETCAVSSTTVNSIEEPHSSATEPVEVKKEESKSELTKEWLEGFLLNIFNPTLMNKHSVLNMLEKVLDDKKFKQIKEIVDESSGDEKEKAAETKPTASIEENRSETPSEEKKEETDSAEPKNATEHKKKHKTELDRLNEDIRDMFISQGVLTATGKWDFFILIN